MEKDSRNLQMEYEDISRNLRSRHQIIWTVRTFYMIALTAFITYAASKQLHLLFTFLFFIVMGSLMVFFDYRYQITKRVLEKRAAEIEEKLGNVMQYRLMTQKKFMPESLQISLIYFLWFLGMIIWFVTLGASF